MRIKNVFKFLMLSFALCSDCVTLEFRVKGLERDPSFFVESLRAFQLDGSVLTHKFLVADSSGAFCLDLGGEKEITFVFNGVEGMVGGDGRLTEQVVKLVEMSLRGLSSDVINKFVSGPYSAYVNRTIGVITVSKKIGGVVQRQQAADVDFRNGVNAMREGRRLFVDGKMPEGFEKFNEGFKEFGSAVLVKAVTADLSPAEKKVKDAAKQVKSAFENLFEKIGSKR